MSFLQLRGLRKDLGEFALQGVDLELQQGRYLAVIGPTGAGKTTLVNDCIGDFLNGKQVLFYGTTVAGAAALMDWPQFCACSS